MDGLPLALDQAGAYIDETQSGLSGYLRLYRTRQADLQALQDKLRKGGATMTPDARAKMQNDLAAGGKALTRDADDLNAEVQEEEGKIMQAMAAKMGDIIQKYATGNGFSVVLDVSGQQTPVLWAAQSANITAEIVKQYDGAHPVKKAAAGSQ